MRWTSLVLALLLLGGIGLTVAPAAGAQELDGCRDTRFGRLGCMSDVQEFNFDDPGVSGYSSYRSRGSFIIFSDGHTQAINDEGMRREARPWMAAGTIR